MSPLYRRNAAHERQILLNLAAHHETAAASCEGEDHEDHLRAAKACRERAEEWVEIGRRAAMVNRGRR
ncbi:MAG: hypothetical protein ACM31D_04695 [Bacteroidota bacterium]